MPKGTTLTSYSPTLKDKLAWFLSDTFGGGDRSRVNYINEKVRGAADLAPVLGDLIGVEDTKRALDEGRYGDAALSGATTAVGSIPGLGDAAAAGLKAGGSALGILMGPTSRLWNRSMADEAANMLSDGRDAQEVWRRTGTAFDPFNGPVQEIQDYNARVHPSREAWEREGKWTKRLGETGFSSDLMRPDMMDDVLTHPEFFDAYPEARGIGVVEANATGIQGPGGAFHSNNPLAAVMDPDDLTELPSQYIAAATPFSVGNDAKGSMAPKSVILHELQHWVQNKEGWDKGFNPGAAMWTLQQKPDSWASRVFQNSINEKAGQLGTTPANVFNMPMLRGDIANRVAMEAYMRNVGETQARTVQAREADAPFMSMFDPTFHMDRPWENQMLADTIMYDKFTPEEVPGLSLMGPARRRR